MMMLIINVFIMNGFFSTALVKQIFIDIIPNNINTSLYGEIIIIKSDNIAIESYLNIKLTVKT